MGAPRIGLLDKTVIFVLIEDRGWLSINDIAEINERAGVGAFFVETFFSCLCPKTLEWPSGAGRRISPTASARGSLATVSHSSCQESARCRPCYGDGNPA